MADEDKPDDWPHLVEVPPPLDIVPDEWQQERPYDHASYKRFGYGKVEVNPFCLGLLVFWLVVITAIICLVKFH